MMCYSIEPRDRILVKGYGYLSFAKNMGKNVGKNISKNLPIKYSHKPLDHIKQSAADALKAVSKTAIQKTAETTGEWIGNKIRKVSRNPLLNNLGTNESETKNIGFDREMPK